MLREESILAILEAVGCGGLILNGSGRVLQTNPRARRYLGSELDISRRGNPSPGNGNHAVQLALREALRASTRILPQLGEYITVPRETFRPLILRSVIVPPGAASESEATAALIVLDMEDCPEPDAALLQDIFLLTPAETRLARHLSRGESLGDISDAVGVSLGTLRVQLKMLFLKTGTRRQGELIALLAHLSRLNAERPDL